MSDRLPTEVDVLDLALRDLQSRLRTLLPGQVVSYNPATARAKVSLVLLGKTTGGQLAKPLVLPSVPVGWPGFAGMTIAGKLNPGDEVLLAVLDRAIDRWTVAGGIVPLESGRLHDLTDAIALPFPLSAKNPPPAGAATALTIGRKDGTATITLTFGPAPGVVTIEAPSIKLGATAVQGAALSTALHAFLVGLITAGVPVGMDGGANLRTTMLAYLAGNDETAFAAVKAKAE